MDVRGDSLLVVARAAVFPDDQSAALLKDVAGVVTNVSHQRRRPMRVAPSSPRELGDDPRRVGTRRRKAVAVEDLAVNLADRRVLRDVPRSRWLQ